jgi:hypothetical protein
MLPSHWGHDHGFVWWCLLIALAFATSFRLGIATLLRFVSFQCR